MALVVEDGTGLSTADAYWAFADVESYHTDYGNLGTGDAQWDDTAADAVKEANVRRATQFLDARIRLSVQGTKVQRTQALVFPRTGVTDEDHMSVDSDSVPLKVRQAMAELARIVPSSQAVGYSKWIESVRAGSVSVKFATASQVRSVLSLVDELVRPFISRSGVRG